MATMRMPTQPQGVPVRVVPDQPRYVRESVMRTVPFAESLFTRPKLFMPRPKKAKAPPEMEIHLSPSSARLLYWMLRLAHKFAALATITVPVTYLLYVGFGLGLLRESLIQGTMVMDYMRVLVLPMAYLGEHVLPMRSVINGFNWWLATAAILTWILRSVLLSWLERAEAWAKTQAFQSHWEEFRGRSTTVQ